MSSSARAVLSRRATLFAGAAVSLLLGLGAPGAASAATGASLYADGLHIPAGGLVDPNNRVWVSDHNGGFCRLSAADDSGPGTIEHPEAPGASPSMDVWRARWNPDTGLFEADPGDVIAMSADTAEDRPRPCLLYTSDAADE